MAISPVDEAIAEAAITVARDHPEECDCYQCEFLFLVYAEAIGLNVDPVDGGYWWNP